MDLAALFASAFLSATVLPGTSEVLFLVGATSPEANVPLMVLVATVGNSLGGMTSWLIGRLVPPGDADRPRLTAARDWIRRYGAAALLASWVPVIGDPLCIAAGWLRIGWLKSVAYITLGKGLRYGLLALLINV